VIIEPMKKHNIRSLGRFEWCCIPDIVQNDFTYVMSTGKSQKSFV